MNSYPYNDIVDSAQNPDLQARGLREMNDWLRKEMKWHEDHLCAEAPYNLEWFLFCSPDWTWRSECGREAWLLLDPDQDWREYACIEYLMS